MYELHPLEYSVACLCANIPPPAKLRGVTLACNRRMQPGRAGTDDTMTASLLEAPQEADRTQVASAAAAELAAEERARERAAREAVWVAVASKAREAATFANEAAFKAREAVSKAREAAEEGEVTAVAAL